MTTLDKPKFEIVEIAGKGMGAISTSTIAAGEIIISETPLFIQFRNRTDQTIQQSLSTKTADEKRQYLRLSNCYKGKGKHGPLRGIFETNALPCGDNNSSSPTGTHALSAGIFLTCSRFNSSCTPNVGNIWLESKGHINIRAMKDISKGEELCISYTNEWLPVEERKQILLNKFGFVCACTACSLEGEALIESDRRRVKLRVLYEEIGGCGNKPVLGVRKVKEALLLLKAEGLIHSTESLCYDAFQHCVAASNEARAKEWMGEGLRAAARTSGGDGEFVLTKEKYFKNPRLHPAWGLHSRFSGSAGIEGPDKPTVDEADSSAAIL